MNEKMNREQIKIPIKLLVECTNKGTNQMNEWMNVWLDDLRMLGLAMVPGHHIVKLYIINERMTE